MDAKKIMSHFVKLGSANVVKMLVGFIYIKVLSTYLLPNEFGNLSQLITFVSIVSMLSLGGANNGIVRLLSACSSSGSAVDLNSLSRKSFTIFFIVALILFFLLNVFADNISIFLVGNYSYVGPVRVFSFIQIISAFGVLSSVIYISKVDTKNITFQTIFGAVFFLAFLFLNLTLSFDIAYSAVFINFFAGVYGVYFFIFKKKYSAFSFRLSFIDLAFFKKISGYAVATLVGAICWPLSQFYLRRVIGETIDWSVVGYWFASIKISDAYIQFFSILLINYLYPRLSSFDDTSQKNNELKRFFILYIPLVLLSAAFIYFFREYIVWLLLGKDFGPASNYMQFQVVGDLVKLIYSALLIYILSCGKVKYSVFVEIVNSGLLILFTIVFIKTFGWATPLIGYIITQSISLLYVLSVYVKMRIQ